MSRSGRPSRPSQPSESLPEIAQIHGVSLPSLYRILRRESNVASAPRNRFRDTRRERFIDELRSMLPRRAQNYMWLYRNDHTWLGQQISLQVKSTSRSTKLRADWSMRDIIFSEAIQHWAKVFYATVAAIWVCTTLLARSTGKPTTIEKYPFGCP